MEAAEGVVLVVGRGVDGRGTASAIKATMPTACAVPTWNRLHPDIPGQT